MPSDSAKVYVGGVDKSATETDLQMEFDKFGRVISVWIGALRSPDVTIFASLVKTSHLCFQMPLTHCRPKTPNRIDRKHMDRLWQLP